MSEDESVDVWRAGDLGEYLDTSWLDNITPLRGTISVRLLPSAKSYKAYDDKGNLLAIWAKDGEGAWTCEPTAKGIMLKEQWFSLPCPTAWQGRAKR